MSTEKKYVVKLDFEAHYPTVRIPNKETHVMEELKPCPFCGCNKVQIRTLGSFNYHAWCPKCRASSAIFEEPIDALTAWNDRVVL